MMPALQLLKKIRDILIRDCDELFQSYVSLATGKVDDADVNLMLDEYRQILAELNQYIYAMEPK